MVDTQRTYAELITLLADNGNRNVSAQDIRDLLVSLVQPPSNNRLINGGFDFWQRSGGGSVNFADDAYCADRWIMLTQTAAVTAQRYQYGVYYKGYNVLLATQPQVTAQRYGLEQIIEGPTSYALRGENVRLDFRANVDVGTRTLHSAILEWTGTIDAITSDVVLDWTSGTFTAGNFFLASNLTVRAVGTHVLGTTPVRFSLNATVGASTNNIIVLVWFDAVVPQSSGFAIGDVFFGIDAGPDAGSSQIWSPRSPAEELVLCQRFYEKSYSIDQVVGAASITAGLVRHNAGFAAASGTFNIQNVFQVSKRVAPTLSYWDLGGNASKITELSASVTTDNITAAGAGAGPVAGTHGFYFNHDPAGNIDGFFLHYAADAEL